MDKMFCISCGLEMDKDKHGNADFICVCGEMATQKISPAPGVMRVDWRLDYERIEKEERI